MTLRVPRTQAFGGADFATTRLRVPWGPEDGLFVFDPFGGDASARSPIEVPMHRDLVRRGTFPYVILSCFDGETALLGQRWFDRPIDSWKLAGELAVSCASVCLTPRSAAQPASDASTGPTLRAAEKLVHDAPDLWAQVALGGEPVLGVRITTKSGKYPLHLALDSLGNPMGWVLDLGAETTA